jgi:hypothetical protein
MVPFKPIKPMAEVRQVLPESTQNRKRHQMSIVDNNEGDDPYEVNEKTMFALRMKKEEELLKKLTPEERLIREQQQLELAART